MQSNNIFELWITTHKIPYLQKNHLSPEVIEVDGCLSKVRIIIQHGHELGLIFSAGVEHGIDLMHQSLSNSKTVAA